MALTFPDGFLWGASTAAFQIEGAVREDGRGPSIWDTFTRTPGRILGDDTGDVACDHYHRWREDVGLMRELGIGAYRLSTAWPRILPEGRGQPNLKGLEFYDRLVDAVMAVDVEPWICLYHWDLPQALEDRGGWQNRDVAAWFADYANLAVRRLGDRVKHWATFNEPNAASIKGYCEGEHAPGIRGRESGLRAIHVMNSAHGLAVGAMRSERPDLLIGNIYNFHPREPATDREEDQIAAITLDALWNRSFPDPQILGHYPEPLATEMEALVEPGDLEAVQCKPDYFAINHYTRTRVRRDPNHPFEVGVVPPSPGTPATEMGWEIVPEAFRSVLVEVKERYSGDLPIYVLENGAAFPDRVEQDGRVRDQQRIAYLRDYLGAALDAIEAGVPLRGYFVWSLLDNFEWTLGYSKRFGLVHVDYDTLERRAKDSFYFYAELAVRCARPGVMASGQIAVRDAPAIPVTSSLHANSRQRACNGAAHLAENVMIDHVGFSVSDYALAKAFYERALAPLGYRLVMEVTAQETGQPAAGFGSGGKPDFWIAGEGKLERPVHIAITANDRATVDAFHRAAIAAGGRDNGSPGLRPHYHPNYYAAFVLDLDGHNIEAVCHTPV